MRSLTAPALSALSQPSVAMATLIKMVFTGGTVCFNTTGWTLTWGGDSYLAVGQFGQLQEIDDSPGEVKGVAFSLSGVSSDAIALALVEPVQGKPITIYTAIFDPSTYQIADAAVEWAGRIDVFTIEEDGETCTLRVTAEHAGIDLLRPAVVRYTDADQRRLYPGDLAFQYVIDQSDKQIVWPSREFFKLYR